MELHSAVHAHIASIDPAIAGVFQTRFQTWLNTSPTGTSARHQLVIFLHVELSHVRDSIDLRGYLCEQLDDQQFLQNFMQIVYPKLSRVWIKSVSGGGL